MQEVPSFLFPAPGKRRRVPGVHGLLFGLPLSEADDFTGHEIDGGEQEHK